MPALKLSGVAMIRSVAWFVMAPVFGLASAQTPAPTSASFVVSAVVSAGCVVVGSPLQTAGLNFGMLDFGTHPAVSTGSQDASLTIGTGSLPQIQCTAGVPVLMTLDGGQNASGAQRRMKMGASDYLAYTLFGPGGVGAPILPGVGIAIDAGVAAITLPVTGRVTLPGSGLPAGTYSDTVQVQISW